MRNVIRCRLGFATLAVCVCAVMLVGAQRTAAPAGVQAALLLKLIEFHKGITADSVMTVYVAGSAEVAAELKKAIGKKIGETEFRAVDDGAGVPKTKPSVIYVGAGSKAEDIVAYCRQHKVVSFTGVPEAFDKGVTLGAVVESGKLKVLFNPEASKEEGAEWAAGLFRIIEGAQ